MTGVEKLGLALLIIAAPYATSLEGWRGAVIGLFILLGAFLFITPQRKS